jgi:HPt (histidine-containing phosphotransfer) domain-containing protein
MSERRNAASLFQHSLKTPLSSVKIAAQLLYKHLQGKLNETDTQLLDTILRNAHTLELRLNKIIEMSTPWEDRIFIECELDHLESIHALQAEPLQPPQPPPPPAPEEKIVIHADPEIADLIPRFLENRHKDIDSIRACLNQGDFEAIRMLGHSMKGAGGGYGFQGISEIGKQIEDAAKQNSNELVQEGLNQLNRYLARVEVIYDSE